MKKHRVNIVCAVNAANVSKSGERYTVRDVVHAVDGIVLNGRLYPGDELAKAAEGLEGRPAPAGHPKDSKGRHISAANGEALASAWVGAYCVNARYEGGRALCDIVINADQARAMQPGRDLLARLDAALDGTNSDPISVSSGLFLREIAANGESRGKPYRAVAADMQFDHLAILLNEAPAATPAEGVGMFVNSDGSESKVEQVQLDTAPADKRHAGLLGWVRRLFGNTSEMSFDQVQSMLRRVLPEDGWPIEIFSKYLIWAGEGNRLFRQDYAVASDGLSVSLTSDPVEVTRRVDYPPVTNQEIDPMKDQILAALNAAGISTEGKTDAQVLQAYNALVGNGAAQPVRDQLSAVNAELKTFKDAAAAVENAARDALVLKLATNAAGLTADELKALPISALQKLAGAAQGAAPVVVGNAGAKADEFAGYDINAL